MTLLLWIVLLSKQACIYLFKLELSPDKYPEMELLDHMVAVLISFTGTFTPLEVNYLHQLLFHQQCGKFAFSSHPPQHLLFVDFLMVTILLVKLPSSTSSKASTCQCRRRKRCGFHLWFKKIPWSWKWQTTPVSLPGKSHRQRSVVDCSHGIVKSWTWLSMYACMRWRFQKNIAKTDPFNWCEIVSQEMTFLTVSNNLSLAVT